MSETVATIAYFERQLTSNQEFWRRFSVEPEFDGLSVLDLGCGQGAMAVRMAQAGAAHVLGVDLDDEAIESARHHLANDYPELASRVEYRNTDVAAVGADETFDLIVSKDTFEHVADLDGLLPELYRLLKPGGCLYAGFSPLYYSPFGDHDRTGLAVPWAHAVLPPRITVAWARWRLKEDFRSLLDLGLNGWTPAQYRSAFAKSPFTVEAVAYNRGDKPLMNVLSRARRFAPLEKYCTVSIYAILRRPV